jgi:hypothetical protein
MRLDGAREMDRLSVTIGQIDAFFGTKRNSCLHVVTLARGAARTRAVRREEMWQEPPLLTQKEPSVVRCALEMSILGRR